jgi:hypothetical protein
MKTKPVMLFALLAGAIVPACAEALASDASTAPLVQHIAVRQIRNAPYSAEMVTERQQNLADGNQIAERNSTMSYRDSAGRTRQEVRNTKGELQVVTIHDPASGTSWILRPQDRSATRVGGDAAHWAAVGRAAGEAARQRIEQLRKEGRLPDDAQRGAVIVKRVDRTDGDVLNDVRIQLARPMGQLGLAPLAGAFGDTRWAAAATTKELGTREFDGVKAAGKLRSYEIPAGEIGNRNPIVVSDETWFAPDLQITVYAKHSDPRSAEVVSRIEHLKREEPAAALFGVPADYTVREVPVRAKN